MARRVPSGGKRAARRYHHGDLRRALLDASLDLVRKNGLEALSLREAARRAGVSSGAPYHHFPSRNDLIAAIAEEGFGLMAGTMTEAVREVPDGDRLGAFEAIGRGYVRFALAHPAHFQAMFRALPRDYPRLREAAAPVYALVAGGIRDLQAAGAAPAGDPEPLVLLAWAAAHGTADLAQRGAVGNPRSPLPFDRADVGRVMARALAGLFERAAPAAARAR